MHGAVSVSNEARNETTNGRLLAKLIPSSPRPEEAKAGVEQKESANSVAGAEGVGEEGADAEEGAIEDERAEADAVVGTEGSGEVSITY